MDVILGIMNIVYISNVYIHIVELKDWPPSHYNLYKSATIQ